MRPVQIGDVLRVAEAIVACAPDDPLGFVLDVCAFAEEADEYRAKNALLLDGCNGNLFSAASRLIPRDWSGDFDTRNAEGLDALAVAAEGISLHLKRNAHKPPPYEAWLAENGHRFGITV